MDIYMMGRMFPIVPEDVDLVSHTLQNHPEEQHQGEVYRCRHPPLLDLPQLFVFLD